MSKQIKAYLFLIATLAVGLFVLVVSDKIKLPYWLNTSAVILAIFILLNILYDAVFKLDVIKEYWAVKKLIHFLPAALAGAIIAFAPAFLAFIFGQLNPRDIQYNITTSFPAILLTFIIVGWEELWFRGVILNYSNKYLSPVNISLTIGFLFMVIHALNPQIELLKKGPALFFAGALLTILYFHHRSIWVPWGLHFGNNFFGNMIKTPKDNDIFFGGDGYISAIVLALLFVFFISKNNKHNTHLNNI